MNAVTVLSIDMIVSDPQIRDGRPIINGTTLRVQDIAIGYEIKGYTLDELLTHYPTVNRAQLHAALAYYYAHKAEIDSHIRADDEYARRAKDEGLGQRHKPVL